RGPGRDGDGGGVVVRDDDGLDAARGGRGPAVGGDGQGLVVERLGPLDELVVDGRNGNVLGVPGRGPDAEGNAGGRVVGVARQGGAHGDRELGGPGPDRVQGQGGG